jgi:hypothetical protein
MHILDKPLEIERLALVAFQMLDDYSQPLVSRPIEGPEQTFREALPKAYRLLQVTEEFLAEKDKEKETSALAYWSSPDGLARIAEIKGRFKDKTEK